MMTMMMTMMMMKQTKKTFVQCFPRFPKVLTQAVCRYQAWLGLLSGSRLLLLTLHCALEQCIFIHCRLTPNWAPMRLKGLSAKYTLC